MESRNLRVTFFFLLWPLPILLNIPPPKGAYERGYDITHNEQSIRKLRWHDEQYVLYYISLCLSFAKASETCGHRMIQKIRCLQHLQ